MFGRMDLIDQKLIEYIDNKPRAAQSQIARDLRISQQVVNYRMNRLFRTGTINKVSAIIDYMSIGYNKYIVFFKLNRFVDIESELFTQFARNTKVWWAAKTGSFYDLMVMVIMKNVIEFQRFVQDLENKFPAIIGEHIFLHATHHELYNHKVFGSTEEKDRMGYSIPEKPMLISSTDLKVLDILRDDCRRSNLSIANELGINHLTVRNKIARLEDLGIIVGYRLFHRIRKYKAYLILVSYSRFSQSAERQLLSTVYAQPQFTMWWKLFGKYSLLLHARCRDYEELQEIFTRVREKHSVIGQYRLIPVFKDIVVNSFPHD